ncbi:hypothetical protein KBI23_05555 [bacterium]|nr:hypothetical protein [bacterium]MBP9810593.1 hypothetical protein [bacterium]
MYRNTIEHKALLVFGTTVWFALAAFWLALITWQDVAIISAACVLAMMAVSFLPGPAELFFRRHRLRVELQIRLVFLQQQLTEAKDELERCQNILIKSGLPSEMQARYRLASRSALLSVISKETQIAQTSRDAERLQAKVNESYAELEQLVLARQRIQMAQQVLRVVCA